MLILVRSIRAADCSMDCKDVSLWKVRETYFSGQIQGEEGASCADLLHGSSNSKEDCPRKLPHQRYELGKNVSLELSSRLVQS